MQNLNEHNNISNHFKTFVISLDIFEILSKISKISPKYSNHHIEHLKQLYETIFIFCIKHNTLLKIIIMV